MSKKKLLLIVMLIFVFIIYGFGYHNALTGKIISILLMGLCLFNMYKSKNNVLGFLLHFQLFYYNYSVVFSRYLHYANEYLEFYERTNVEILNIGILCLFIFEIFTTLFYDNSKPFKREYIYAKQKNNLISILLLIAAFIVGVLGFDWGGFGSRTTVAITPFYEYNGILLILGLHYAGLEKSKIIKSGYTLLIIFLVLQGFLFGERVSALQFMFIWFFYFKGDSMKPKQIFLLAVAGIFLMNIVGFYRGGSGNFDFSNIDFSTIFNSLGNRLLTFNGDDLGYYCSLTFVMVSKIVPYSTRFGMFIKFLGAIFIGDSVTSNLPNLTVKYYSHWGGGYFPLYFYFYGGILMVIFSSYIWNKFLCGCIQKTKSKHPQFKYLVGMYLVCVCARWYTYTPLHAIRPVLLFSLAYFVLYLFNKKLQKNESKT